MSSAAPVPLARAPGIPTDVQTLRNARAVDAGLKIRVSRYCSWPVAVQTRQPGFACWPHEAVDAVLALSANRDPANVRRYSDTSRAFEASRFTVKTPKRSAA
jgi:hypothetical protein